MKNGSWNGIIQMVISNEVDVGVGSFTLTADRFAVVDGVTPLKISRSDRGAQSRVQWQASLIVVVVKLQLS
jgi:hypothetical protein